MKSLKESLLDDEDILMDNTTVTEEDAIKKYIEEHYNVYPGIKIWVKKSRKIVQANNIIPKRDTETLELPYGYKWESGPNGTVYILMNDKIKNLKGCPEYVSYLSIRGCDNFESLEGAPQTVEEVFEVENCPKLKNLKGGPKYVNRKYDVDNNKGLISLEGAPTKMSGSFFCGHTNITSLKYIPQMIKGRISCVNCLKLTSLEGLPRDLNFNKVSLSVMGCKNLSEEYILNYFNIKKEEVINYKINLKYRA